MATVDKSKASKAKATAEGKLVDAFLKKHFPKASWHYIMIFTDSKDGKGTSAFAHASVSTNHLMAVHENVHDNLMESGGGIAALIGGLIGSIDSSKLAKTEGKKKAAKKGVTKKK